MRVHVLFGVFSLGAILGPAAWGHVRHLGSLGQALGSQRLLPAGTEVQAAWALAATEVVVVGSLVVAALGVVPPAAALVPALLLGLMFVGWLSVLLAIRRGVPCACDAKSVVGWSSIVRAGAVVVLAGAALVPLDIDVTGAPAGLVTVVTALVAVGFGAALWVAPPMLRSPS